MNSRVDWARLHGQVELRRAGDCLPWPAILHLQFNGDQETPDTSISTVDFCSKCFIWDGRGCHPPNSENLPFVAWYGDGYKLFDPKGKHLSNTAYRTGHMIHFDPVAKKIVGNRAAEKFWAANTVRDGSPRCSRRITGNEPGSSRVVVRFAQRFAG